MSYIHNFFSSIIIKENATEFYEKKFMHNNLCIFILSFYLTIEQLYYGFYVAASGELIQKIHFTTVFVMSIYCIIAGFIYIKKVKKISWLGSVYEISFGFFGFAVAIARALLIHNNIFVLPTVYVAVIYGFAVFFYFRPLISFSIYCITSISIITLLPMFQPGIIYTTYAQDIISNNIIAWIAAIISYQRYIKDFKNQKIISNKNEQLQAKTKSIQKINEALQYISTIDELTNIYNRRKLNEILEQEFDRCMRTNRNISLILLDVDLFKQINDTYGHNVGDKVLAEVGEILKTNVNKKDKVGRWGGEEFLIICPETDLEMTFYLAEKIRKTIENYNFQLEESLTCSFGVSTNKKIDTITNLILRADKGLYKAKESGRNKVETEHVNIKQNESEIL